MFYKMMKDNWYHKPSIRADLSWESEIDKCDENDEKGSGTAEK